jgi:hypothetical protein
LLPISDSARGRFHRRRIDRRVRAHLLPLSVLFSSFRPFDDPMAFSMSVRAGPWLKRLDGLSPWILLAIRHLIFRLWLTSAAQSVPVAGRQTAAGA